MKPQELTVWKGEGDELPAIEFARHRVIKDRGYLLIPAFASIDTGQMQAFADTIQAVLLALYNAGVKGWIIDMRQNTGGNMTPMIAGLGPLLDEGPLGGLLDVNGKAERWSYDNGALCWDGVPGFRVPHPITLPKRLPIEVLIGGRTGSSGEFTTVSFVGNARTRLVGEPTWGLTTGNGEFDLPDGARMFMASTVMMDRNGKRYHGPIQPDVRVERPADGSYDAALQEAIDHLSGVEDK
jgi:C-terminal processing protease CtpA/Prc